MPNFDQEPPVPHVRRPRPADAQHGELSVRGLYLQLAGARAATIQQALWQSTGLPESPAETLTLAAAELAYVTGHMGAGVCETARAASVARRLTAEAERHDPRARALAELALEEIEDVAIYDTNVSIVREAADSLAWACAVLRHTGDGMEDAEDGNADQLELAWMCLIEAADLHAAADRASTTGAGREA